MHGTYVHLCLMANLKFNAAEYAMNFCQLSPAGHPKVGKTMQGTCVSPNTLEADWGGVISHAQRAL